MRNSLKLSMARRPVAILAAIAATALSLGIAPVTHAGAATLRVCADPNNFPFSDRAGEGFENKIAALTAQALGEGLSYTWSRQDHDFFRRTLDAGTCDAVMSVPNQLESVERTQPYYESSYVFVSRADRDLDISSIKDKRLKQVKIGIELIDPQGFTTPPGQMLAERGIVANAVGYPIYDIKRLGDGRARMIADVAKGKLGLAAICGPGAGYFVRHSAVPLQMLPIGDTEEFSTHKVKFKLFALQYDIAMAVRKGDDARRAMLDRVIAEHKPQITDILKSFGVPLVEPLQASLSHGLAAD